MRDLIDIRKDIDKLDEELIGLFEKRLSLADEVADYKKEKGMPIFDKEREEAILSSISERYEEPFMKEGIRELFVCLMGVSKKRQEKRLGEE